MTAGRPIKFDRDQIVAAHESGESVRGVALKVGASIQTVYLVLRERGCQLVGRGGRNKRKDYAADPRVQRMATMHAQGMTLAKIGEVYGMTRERVRQLITKIGGEGARLKMTKALGEAKAHQHQAAVEARIVAKWGIDRATHSRLRADVTIRKYERQKVNARSRGIAWNLAFAQWWAIWQASGKFELCGRGKGHYCMSRIKDTGGYQLGNVHIQPCVDNSREAVDKWRDKPVKANRGVFCLYPGRARPWLAKRGKKSIGYFATEAEAAAARAEFIAANEELEAA